jgi:phytoene dehydrogenase-like protein
MFENSRKNNAPQDAIVVGAGLSGLACALHLHRAGRSVSVLEASNSVGGRVRSDVVDGFTLDRGFQVLLTAYPEAKAVLDYRALDLKKFSAGAFVQLENTRAYLANPLREPKAILQTIKAEIGTPMDKARIARLQFSASKQSEQQTWDKPEMQTVEYLKSLGFSNTIVERFFRPFFGGVFLDYELKTSSRMFDFVFAMLAAGDNAIPACGMGAISDHLASKLPAGMIRLSQRVVNVEPGSVTLIDQGKLRAQTIVIATNGVQASKLLGADVIAEPGSSPVSCLYFSADEAPFQNPSIVLNGMGAADGPVNNFCVPTNVSKSLAPAGKHLLSASILGSHSAADDADLVGAARTQLTRWFGETVKTWKHLRTYHIQHAQPAQPPGVLQPSQRDVSLGQNLFVCGDHRDQASINGALVSGRRVAEAVLAQLA